MVREKRGLIFVLVVILLALFFISFFSVSAQAAGCILHPTDSEMYCVDNSGANQEACAEDPNCLAVPQACEILPNCEYIECGTSEGCQFPVLRGLCTAPSEPLTSEQSATRCFPGCCKILASGDSSEPICEYGPDYYQCQQLFRNYFGEGAIERYFSSDSFFPSDQVSCLNQCGVELAKANLKITVNNVLDEPLNANILLTSPSGSTLNSYTDSSGRYIFSNLNAGIYDALVSSAGYVEQTFSVSLSPGSSTERVITLLKPGVPGKVSGKVFYMEAGTPLPLSDTRVTISSTSSSLVFTVTTVSDGSYSQDSLPPGAYSLTASHLEYGSEQTIITLSEAEDLTGIDLTLQGQIFQGVKGIVYLNSIPVPGAEIFLDGRYLSLSREAGYYQLPLPADSTVHTLRTTYAGYYEAEGTFMITPAQPIVELNLILQRAEAICTAGNWLPISTINYEFTPGEPEVTLSWTSPCPEVIGYQVTRVDPSGEEISNIYSSLVTSYWDYGLEWGQIYTYTITALYAYEARIYTSEGFSIDLQIGDEICSYYAESATFCEVPEVADEYTDLLSGASLSGAGSSSTSEDPIFSCGPDNRYTQIDACEEGFCTSDREGGTTCLSDDACKSGGRPFGLYYERDYCYYGAASLSSSTSDSTSSSSDESELLPPPAQFCYYDYPIKNTIVDSCESCSKINSCFDYLSKDACEFNSCLTSQCQWVDAADISSADSSSSLPMVDYSSIFRALDLREEDAEAVFPETGAGFCVQEEYNQDDQCFKCDNKNGNVFENYFCTPDVCTGLGRCFSNPLGYPGRNEPLLSFCASCGTHPTELSTCYTYTNELECVDNNSIRATNGVISYSRDNCNWGRCYWDGSSCLKDGNFDEEGDCSDSDSRCKQDNAAPITSILNGPVPQISLVSPLIEFEGDDSGHEFGNQQNDLLTFGSCLISADSPEACTEFKTLDYSRRTGKEKINLNVINELTEKLDGKIYQISYYSEDEYFNRESAKSSLIYIDNVIPEFEINQTILVNEDRVKLKAWLANPSELMSCNFTLSRPGADVSLQSFNLGFDQVKNVEFTERVNLVNAELNVTCVDLSGNKNSKKKSYTFDLEENIELVYPLLDSAIAETGISFEVKTTVDARCALLQNNVATADFSWVGDTRKVHQTERILGFTQRDYFNEIKVVCHPFAEMEDFSEDFHFSIDLTPPKTQIILTEGAREYQPTERVWETAFVNSAGVKFNCLAEGFPCEKTYYCLGAENDLLACPPFPNDNYQEYHSAGLSTGLTINSTSRICYYSTDTAGNKIFSANCGTVYILGFGIDFEFPKVYTYQGENWAISSVSTFDWRFSTRVPTQECKYDFKPNFNYYDVLEVQTIRPNAQGKYHVSNFPQNVFKSYPGSGGIYEVYIRCLGLSGELGPENKYIMEYDPNYPEITRAYADPDHIYEETKTNLFAFTNRKTICKYSDDSEGQGSASFETMEYSFPGLVENILYLEHEDIFNLNSFSSTDGKKDFTLNTQCSTGAELLSEVKEITFKVDYSSLGFISNMYAGSGGKYVYSYDVPLYVETSKNAVCSYLLDGSSILFTETGGKAHTTTLFGLTEGTYEVPVRCEMEGGHFAEGIVSFTIDLTAPVISKVEDGNLTCGSPEIMVFVQSNEVDISNYYYEVYSLGPTTLKSALSYKKSLENNTAISNSSSGFGLIKDKNMVTSTISTLVLNGTTLGLSPININLSWLINPGENVSSINSNKYITQVWAQDEAGNEGLPKKSDGIIVTSADYSECVLDQAPPKVNFIFNTTCLDVLVSMECADVTGCKEIKYALTLDEEECTTNQSLKYNNYDGSKLSVERTSWICYRAADYLGNQVNGTKKVVFQDNDGDAIENSCDLCTETPPGKLAGPDGCSFGEIPGNETMADADSDSLPDSWEKIYDAFDCAFNYASPDTNENGLSDAEEDYDQDGASNYEEYLAKTDPCLADDAPGDWKVQDNPWGKGKNLTSGETPKLPEPPKGPTPSGTSNLIPLLLLVIGLLITLGGIGYLVYYYQYSPESQLAARNAKSGLARGSAGGVGSRSLGTMTSGQKKPLLQKEQLLSLRRQKLDKAKSRSRTSLFGEFSSGSAGLSTTKPKEVQKETNRENEPRVENKASLKTDSKTIDQDKSATEGSLFSKLKNMGTKTDRKSLQDVVQSGKSKGSNEGNNQDVFGKLKDLSKKKKR